MAGVVGGVVGTGSSIILLPVLVYAFGPEQAVPIMAVAAVMANVARVAVWWRDIHWTAFIAYALPAVPCAALGAHTLLELSPTMINTALGLFFLLMVPGRHWLQKNHVKLSLWQLGMAGAVIGFLTGVVLSTGPLSVPAFASFGLLKGALLSTEAATSLFVYASKSATFHALGALPNTVFLKGLIVGSSLMVGAFIGKILVLKMSTETFVRLLDGILILSGLSLLWAAIG